MTLKQLQFWKYVCMWGLIVCLIAEMTLVNYQLWFLTAEKERLDGELQKLKQK